MAIELVTGHAGEGHVSSADAGRYNAGVCGVGKYVLNTGQKFAYSIESANLIRIGTGDAVNQGRHISIRQNTYEDANILNGTQGKTRIDVITLRYSKVTRQVEGEPVTVEVATVEVIKGTEVPVGTAPEVPAVISGNIFDGATTDDMPLYHVLITDTSVTSVTAVFTVLDPLNALWNQIEDYGSSITSMANKIGDTEMGTTATTLTGAIKELLNRIGTILNTIGNAVLKTDNKSITYAINELHDIIGTSAMGTAATTIKGAINEIRTHDSNQGVYFKIVSLGTFAFESSGACERTVSVASHIPSGYSLQAVIPRTTGTYAAYFYSCAVSGTSVWFQIMRAANYYTSATTCAPSVEIVCKRNL